MLRLVVMLCSITVALVTIPVGASAYPDKPIRLIVPYPPGGGADTIARLVAQKMSAALGQSVYVENRNGANGNIGSDIVAKAAPDGYTLLMNTIGLVLSQSIYKRLPFDVSKDFSPVALVASSPHVLIVGPSLPVKSVPELIAAAKERPGKLNCASVAIGSPFQMAAELFKSLANVQIQEVPYQGGGPAVLSVIAGQTDMTFANLLAAQPFIKAGTVKALAVTGKKRFADMPDVPTVDEAGLPGYEFNSWFGIWAPAGTPRPIIDILNREIASALNDPAILKRLEIDGAQVEGGSPERFDAFVKSEYSKWDKIVKAANIKVD
jgi:tripartite-type tricarboxylate transporter receptor subunit TctC